MAEPSPSGPWWLEAVSSGCLGLSYVALALLIAGSLQSSALVRRGWFAFGPGAVLGGTALIFLAELTSLGRPTHWVESLLRLGTALLAVRATYSLRSLLPDLLHNTPAEGPREQAVKLEQVDQELYQLMSRARELDQLKSSFLGLVSHELRTPVTTLRLQLERLRRMSEGKEPRQDELLARMSTTTRRLTELVDSLLQYARVQSGRLTAEPRKFDLRELAREVADELTAQAESKGLSLSLLAPMPVPLHSDPELVRLVLVNLIGNAIKFTEHGSVKLSLQRNGEWVRLAVEDTGPGIAPGEQSRIFEPFEHIEPTRHKHTPGVGLGLSLVREMAGVLGGEIEVVSEPGRGSTFSVRLPTQKSN